MKPEDTIRLSVMEFQLQPEAHFAGVRLKLNLHMAKASGVRRKACAPDGRSKLKDHDAKAYGV
jgi:hypothetical protein